MSGNPGEKCSCCPDDPVRGKIAERLIEVRGAVVCPVCDNVSGWPKKPGKP